MSVAMPCLIVLFLVKKLNRDIITAMKTISAKEITECVKNLCIEASEIIDKDVLSCIKCAYQNEDESLPKEILSEIIENDILAEKEHLPMCQDTGIMVVFVEIGNQVFIDGDINKAINDGVAQGYTEGFLRKSVVASPLNRRNTGDNTPAIIHVSIVRGENLKITLCPKGAGSENMSRIKMLTPADGIEGIKSFVLDVIKKAGGRACPPLFVGVGIGGTIEKCALLAKKALTRPINDESDDVDARKLEKELYSEINALDIGPMGLGGKTTALAVKVNVFPCHIASLPVCVNLNCHAVRHKEVVL